MLVEADNEFVGLVAVHVAQGSVVGGGAAAAHFLLGEEGCPQALSGCGPGDVAVVEVAPEGGSVLSDFDAERVGQLLGGHDGFPGDDGAAGGLYQIVVVDMVGGRYAPFR